MTASGIFLPCCLPWISWWRLLYFSPSELDQQDRPREYFNWVHLTGTGQKTLRRAPPMAGLQRGDWSALGSAWGCTSGTQGRLDGEVFSMDGHSLFFYTQSNHYHYQWEISKNTADKTPSIITSTSDYISTLIWTSWDSTFFMHVFTYRHICAHIWMQWQQNLNKQTPLYVWAYVWVYSNY